MKSVGEEVREFVVSIGGAGRNGATSRNVVCLLAAQNCFRINVTGEMFATAVSSHRCVPSNLLHDDRPEIKDMDTVCPAGLDSSSSVLRCEASSAWEGAIWCLLELMLIDRWRCYDDDVCSSTSLLLENWVLDDRPDSVNVGLKFNVLWSSGYAGIVSPEENRYYLDARPSRTLAR